MTVDSQQSSDNPKGDKPKRLGILISGRGSNMASIMQAIQSEQLPAAEIAVVISNKVKAPGLEIARQAGIPTQVVPMKDLATGEKKPLELFDAEIVTILNDHQVDAVVLAGYGRIISSVLLEAFTDRIINIHPSLLPAFGGVGMVGLAVHEAVVTAKAVTSGCTVHVVTETVDGGPILGQAEVPVLATDTPESLAHRVLEYEHKLYPTVLQAWLSSGFSLTEQVRLSAKNELSQQASSSVVS